MAYINLVIAGSEISKIILKKNFVIIPKLITSLFEINSCWHEKYLVIEVIIACWLSRFRNQQVNLDERSFLSVAP